VVGVLTARLLISCEDRPGIVAAVAGFLAERQANIVALDQHATGGPDGEFFARVEFDPQADDLDEAAFGRSFAGVADRFGMDWRISYSAHRKRVAVLVSRYDHCLVDLLWRWRRGELLGDVGLVLSNHPDLRGEAERAGVDFECVPVEAPDAKPAAEARMLELLAGRFDLVVLARYMQILSAGFLEGVGCPVINIHHSFLPSFAGADPYRRAAERGVKLIGATAHYVTEELDEGPIIEQDVERVHHGHDVGALTRIGEDVERTVLARAVRWHLDDRVLLHGPRTVVFA
jgi:formyltetrahydrofolate deformylase